MKYAKLNEDNSVTENYSFRMLRHDNRNTSFSADIMDGSPENVSFLETFSVYVVQENPPTFDPLTQRLVTMPATWDGSQINQNYIVEPLPSVLQGGTREPTSAELDAESQAISIIYWRKKVEEMIRGVAASLEFGEWQSIRGVDTFVGNWNNALAYTSDNTHFLYQRSVDFIAWRSQTWTQANAILGQWQAGSIPAPTWTELQAQLPAAPQLSSYA